MVNDKNLKIKWQTKLIPVLFLLTLLNCPALMSQENNYMEEQFEKKATKLLGVKVYAQSYEMDLATINIENLLIGDKNKQAIATIEKVSATCDLLNLMAGRIILKDISLASANLNLSAEYLKTLKKYKPSAKKTSKKSKSIKDLPFLKLNGKDIKINIKDKRSDRLLTVLIDKVNLAREKDSDEVNAELTGSVKAEKLTKPHTPLFNGQLNSSFKLSGNMSLPKIQGSAKLTKLRIAKNLLKQPLSMPEASFSFSNDKVETQSLQVSWGSSKVKIRKILLDLNKDKLNIGYLIKPLAFGEISTAFISKKGLTISGNGTSEGTITGSSKKIEINGNLEIPRCNVNAPLESAKQQNIYIFPFKNVSATYNYNGETITINDAAAGIFDGKLTGKGEVFPETAPIKFTMNLKGNSLKVEQFLSENSSQKNVVTGTANANFNATGNSSGLKSMQGDGSFIMPDGNYQAPPVITPALSLLNLRQFASGKIESGQGTFKLKNGIMNTDDLLFVAEAGKLYYRGQVGLDTSLSGKMSIIFTQNALAESQILRQISSDGKNAKIPTRVEGTLLSPSFPGLSAQNLLELGLKRRGQKMLQDILLPERQNNDSTETEKTEEQNSPEEHLLKGLQHIFEKRKRTPAEMNKNANSPPDPKQDEDKKDTLEDKLKNIFKF
ncbi:MAG: AsmA-like C-terminal region-containing protein [Candidatus Rifleibacteriota bacterium]